MITQHEWVKGCYAYYAENGYEPGNPEDGDWHNCHYPVPNCLAGTETVKLLKEHHAVHGVLQSEEYKRPCVYGWETNYLSGELHELCEYWLGKRGFNSYPSEQRSEWANEREAAQTPEQRQQRARRAHETRRQNGRRTGAQDPDTMAAMAVKCSERARRTHASRTPEQRSAIARKGQETRRLRRMGLA